MRRLLFPLVLTLLLAAPALGAEPTRFEIPLEEIRVPADDWYGVYVNGGKAGFAHLSFRREGDRFVMETVMEMKLTAFGTQIRLRERELLHFSAVPPYRLLGAVTTEHEDDDFRIVRFSNAEEGLKAVVLDGRDRQSLERPFADLTLGDDILGLERWIRRGQKPGASVTLRSFSASELTADLETYTVKEVKEAVSGGVPVTWYRVEVRSERDGVQGFARLDGKGRLVSLRAGVLEMRLEPEELAKKTAYSADLFLLGMAKIDRPIGDAEVQTLELEVVGIEEGMIVPGPRQAVREDGVLVLGEAADTTVKATEKEVREGLEATVNHPLADPMIVGLAKQAVGDAVDPRAKVARITEFVAEFIGDEYGADSNSVREVIRRRRGDCTEHALLFTCLARAQGIPTREVGGLMYMGDDAKAFGFHAWNEVALDGVWVPVDPTFAQFPADATHVRLGEDGSDAFVMANTIGRLSFKLRKVVRKE